MLSHTDKSLLRNAFHTGTVLHIGVDMQNYYCDPDNATGWRRSMRIRSRKLAANVCDFTNDTRQMGVKHIWVAHLFESLVGELKNAFTQAAGRAPSQKELALQELRTTVAPEQDDVIIPKRLYNAFTETSLEEELKKRKPSALLMSGLYLDPTLCLAETAVTAAELGYEVFVMRDLALLQADNDTECRKYLTERKVRLTGSHHIVIALAAG